MQAATRAALKARNAPLKPRAKSVAADLVTDADALAEHAAAAIIRAARPDDAIVGEEGTDEGAGARRWYVDGIDGTVGFAAGMPGAWCSAVVLTDEEGALASAVHNPAGELYAAARGEGATLNGNLLALAAEPKPLDQAHVAIFLRQDRLVLPGVRDTAHRVIDDTGIFRHAGPGSLELAWVAAGRLDAWVQPDTDPWDWLPGALLVAEAGGVARTVQRDTRWHVAGPSSLVEGLIGRLS